MPLRAERPDAQRVLDALIQCLRSLDEIGATIPAAHVNTAIEAFRQHLKTPPELKEMQRSAR